ncbi:hypothetical protein ACFPK8_13050, partial [Brachybacterium tyrofermentans]
MPPVITAEGLYKVFGRRPARGVEALRTGRTREQLREDGLTAAVIDAREIVKTCGSVFRYPTEELLAGAVSAGHSDRNCSPVIAFVCSYFLRMSAWVSPST